MYYGARYYDATLGRFVSADTIVPSAGNPQSLNRYAYVYNNPTRFTDPSGYDPLDEVWREAFRQAHQREPNENDIMIRLFSIAYPEEWNPSVFYDKDGQYIHGSLEKVFRDSRPQGRTWDTVPDALERLARFYKPGEESLFTRDIGSLFGGLLNRFEQPDAWSAISDARNPVRVWVEVGPGNMDRNLLGNDRDSNIHHWAWGLAFGAEFNVGASFANEGREITQFNGDIENTWADMQIGNLGAALGVNYRLLGLDPQRMRRTWNSYMYNQWWQLW